jgi:hypothetical protein
MEFVTRLHRINLNFEVTQALFGSCSPCNPSGIFHAYLERLKIFRRLRILMIEAKRVM